MIQEVDKAFKPPRSHLVKVTDEQHTNHEAGYFEKSFTLMALVH